jgi:RNA polymerase sigma-70 factor (ECF subfamily)
MTMWDRFDADAPPTEFVAWGKRIAYHKVLDFYKKSQRAQARLSLIFLRRIAETAAGDADELQLDSRRDALTECVEKLPPRDRELLTRRFADGATTQSASQQLGRSVDAVYKALAKLREALFQCVQNTITREGHA